jgi:hypothetical protein
VTEEKKPIIKILVEGKYRDVSVEELCLSNNLSIEALVKVLVDKKVFKPEELLKVMEEIRKERYKKFDQKT